AIVRVGEKLASSERIAFYQKCLPNLLQYHQWLYRERDIERTGLVTLIHAWEAGNEDTPAWATLLPDVAPPDVKKMIQEGKSKELDARRPDFEFFSAACRPTHGDFFGLYRACELIR